MELDRRQWYVHWFFWSLSVWDEFRGTYTEYRHEKGTNLCHFIRVMLVWCPLVLLLNIAVYGAGILVLTGLPIYLYGGTGYAWIIGSIAFVVGLILVLKYASQYVLERAEQRIWTPRPERSKVATPVKAAPAGPGFWEVLWEYTVATKKKVCPTITFIQTKRDAP